MYVQAREQELTEELARQTDKDRLRKVPFRLNSQ